MTSVSCSISKLENRYAPGTIQQHNAGVAQVLVVLLIELASEVDEHQRSARLQAPCCLIAITVARGLRIQPLRQHTRALIDRAGSPCLVLFI